MKSLLLAFALYLFTFLSAVFAIEVRTAEEAYIDLRSLVFPVTDNSRTFYNGDVTIFNVDTVEPAACAMHLAIVMPDRTQEYAGARRVWVVGCFSSVDIKQAKTSYDPNLGLLLEVPYAYYDGNTGQSVPSPAPVRIRLNMATAMVTLE